MAAKRLAWHANVCGVRPREEELQAATRSFPIVALQETGFRRPEDSQCAFARLWPDHQIAAEFLQDDEGVGCVLLIDRRLHWRPVLRRSARRHRLLAVEVHLHGRWLRISSVYIPLVASGFDLDLDFLLVGLAAPFSLLLGDLNTRAESLGCRTTNAHGRALADFLEQSEAMCLCERSQSLPFSITPAGSKIPLTGPLQLLRPLRCSWPRLAGTSAQTISRWRFVGAACLGKAPNQRVPPLADLDRIGLESFRGAGRLPASGGQPLPRDCSYLPGGS